MTGLKPDEVRAMTPRDFVLFIDGWNEAHAGDEPEPPSAEALAELVRKYG